MEVTKFILSGREKARLNGDWKNYQKQLSKRLRTVRRKLGIATKPRAKYAGGGVITAENINISYEYGYMLLLTSERAWANAMCVREAHSAEKKGITGSARSYVISRLKKSTLYARNLLDILKSDEVAGTSVNDMLEVRAYLATLSGALQIEKKCWKSCMSYYSEARIIYCVLGTITKSEVFKEIISDPVDPSIRYCAYQLQLNRTLAATEIARNFFPSSDTKLVALIESLDADFLNNKPVELGAEHISASKTINWRSRTISLEDAAIIAALKSIKIAEKKLSGILSNILMTKSNERASAYDDILTVSQEAVDTTKRSINELESEGVSQDDQRIQSLQIIRTAFTYEMISWRIGRNRVLLGHRDGVYGERVSGHENSNSSQKIKKEEGIKRKLARLRRNVVLYDSILQSLISIKELNGIAADTSLVEELDAKYEYFSSLKYLAIARSHSLLSNNRNALALFFKASVKCEMAHTYFLSAMEEIEESPIKISITSSEIQYLRAFLDGEVQRHRALVEIFNLTMIESEKDDNKLDCIPLIERLSDFPVREINMSNLVVYPPVLEPAPVKPLFFDAAWNYIRYPGKEVEEDIKSFTQAKSSAKNQEHGNTAKKGWFGLGL
ncbi:hypothetical protein Golomagni_01669 [Golovinomyces magnicellulatus]|nr:hypothetical protein Golomagni_01669 [Golovinomyces magnicellulatus]